MFIFHFVYFQIGKIIFLFKTHENKCNVLEVIPYDLDKSCCEIIVVMCLRMFSGVAPRNVAIGGDEHVLHIIEGVQIIYTDVSDEEGFQGSKGEDDSQALTMSEILAPPPSIDNGKSSYIQKEKRSTRSSIARNKTPKKKAKKNNSLLETQNTKAKLSNVNLQVDEDLLASLNSLGVRTSIASFIDAVLRGEGDGQEKERISEALRNIEPLDTLSPM
jgi:hypothetical protein